MNYLLGSFCKSKADYVFYSFHIGQARFDPVKIPQISLDNHEPEQIPETDVVTQCLFD